MSDYLLDTNLLLRFCDSASESISLIEQPSLVPSAYTRTKRIKRFDRSVRHHGQLVTSFSLMFVYFQAFISSSLGNSILR